jgi:GT2 family glycosyltransferase
MKTDPHPEHRIATGVRGWLESPAAAMIAPGFMIVSGWAFAAGNPLQRVWVEWLGKRYDAQYGAIRDDVARAYPDEAARQSGFSADIEFDGPREPADLLLWAATANGEPVRLFRRRLTVRPADADRSGLQEAMRAVLARPSLVGSPSAWRALAARTRSALGSDRSPSAVVDDGPRVASRAFLKAFLASGATLTLPAADRPLVSLVIVVWNRAELTLRCLRSLASATTVPIETIVVDNASTDETPALLERVADVRVRTNQSNDGFLAGANLGARMAHGEFVLFLNNDLELLPGTVDRLVAAARRAPSIGAVGGKLVFPDGRLQEAGAIVWSDGSCEAYGRGDDPSRPEFSFARAVDFCSGALLLTPRAVFEQLCGFDERYRPAYYEDADYCARLWANGYSVRYEPRAVAVHDEFGSASSKASAIRLQRERRAIFVDQHRDWLSTQPTRAVGTLRARSHPYDQPTALVVDDAPPDPRLGAGFPRAAALAEALGQLGYQITLFATSRVESAFVPRHCDGLEVIAGGTEGLAAFLRSRITQPRRPDVLVVSRPHNMRFLKAAIGSDLSTLGLPCIYDAEAVFAVREIGRSRLAGHPVAESEEQTLLDRELELARGCSAVLAVSDAERRLFAASGAANVRVLRHAVAAEPTPSPFDLRRTVLFVGSFAAGSPNEDAARFLCGEIVPALRRAGFAAPVVIAGAGLPRQLQATGGDGVSWQADVDDLSPLYDAARVFVAPTRFGAGIPLKAIEAAARGVPIVGAPLVAEQLAWSGAELTSAASAEEFAQAIAALYADSERWSRQREAAVTRVATDYSPEAFRSALAAALATVAGGPLRPDRATRPIALE